MIFVKFGANMPKLLLIGLVERTCAKTVVREIPGIVDCFQLAGDDNEGKIVVRSPDRGFKPHISFRLFTALHEWFKCHRSLEILLFRESTDQRRRYLYKSYRRNPADLWCGGCSHGDCEGDERRLRGL